MIPKIIHYCWLSKEPYPEKISRCIKSWSKHLCDYEIILWDVDKCKKEGAYIPWVIEAFENKKYAFAADYIRMFALYHYGGIYLDSDVEVLKNFDDLLTLPYFIGKEGLSNRVEVAAFGAEKGSKWILECMNYYNNRKFVNKDGTYNTKVMPDIVYEIISSSYTIKNIQTINEFIYEQTYFCQFPNDWFCANVYINPTDKFPSLIISPNTYCIHHFANSWINNSCWRNILKKIAKKIGLYNFIQRKLPKKRVPQK